jgi:hypothetical protein
VLSVQKRGPGCAWVAAPALQSISQQIDNAHRIEETLGGAGCCGVRGAMVSIPFSGPLF